MDDLLRPAFAAAVAAVDPFRLVRSALVLDGNLLRCRGVVVADLSRVQRVVVAALGKAASPMARAALEVLGPRVVGGVVVSDHPDPLPSPLESRLGSHPVPDARSLAAGTRLFELASGLGAGDLLVGLTSGGGSALAVLPAEGIDLDLQARTVEVLLRSPLSIAEVNAVRRKLSRLKGGGLARAAGGATVVNLVLSDVPGDDPAVVASGPFAPDPVAAADVLALLDRQGLVPRLPGPVVAALRDRARSEAAAPTPEAPAPDRIRNVVIGSCRTALDAAAAWLRDRGLPAVVLSSMLEGEVGALARFHAQVAREVLVAAQPVAPPCVLLSGGESFVDVRGPGRGGRNQEFALHFARAMDGVPGDWSLLSAGTDGVDGPTDAAGAVADPGTLAAARGLGVSAAEAVAANDSYRFFDSVGGLVRTGRTGTNVGDVRLIRLG